MDIIASLGQLPEEKKIYFFDDCGEPDMFWVNIIARCITVEFIKYSYDSQDPVYSLRHFLGDADDSERMLQSRIMQYVLKYKKKELSENNVVITENHKYANLEMDSIGQKLKGHRLTAMNYFEHQNIHDLELIKSIVEKRIGSVKKVSNTRFIDIFEQYDKMIESLIERSKKSDEDMVFASLAMFTFEWHYPIEFFYCISCMMEENNTNTIDLPLLTLLCARLDNLESIFGGNASIDSRMVIERFVFLPQLIESNQNYNDKVVLMDLIKEILILIAQYKEIVPSTEGELYKEWFKKESNMADWASFFRYYNIFQIYENKDWTKTRIHNMRMLLDLIFGPPIKN